MKVRTPKPWQALPSAQRKSIEDYALRIAKEQNEKDGRIMLDLYIKMVCVTMHDVFGFGEKRLTMFLGSHKRLFRNQRKMVKGNTQLDYLNTRMSEIFKKNGFPQNFFDDMFGPMEYPKEADQ